MKAVLTITVVVMTLGISAQALAQTDATVRRFAVVVGANAAANEDILNIRARVLDKPVFTVLF